MFFTTWESRGYCISFAVKGSRYVTTASPLTPRIYSILDFCNVRVKEGQGLEGVRGQVKVAHRFQPKPQAPPDRLS
jgi:hypothetical protein